MLRARDIIELCDGMGLARSSITVKEGWDHNAQFFLSFGPPAYRQLLEIDPHSGLDAVKARLEAARASPLTEAPIPALEAKPSPAATPAPANGIPLDRKPRKVAKSSKHDAA